MRSVGPRFAVPLPAASCSVPRADAVERHRPRPERAKRIETGEIRMVIPMPGTRTVRGAQSGGSGTTSPRFEATPSPLVASPGSEPRAARPCGAPAPARARTACAPGHDHSPPGGSAPVFFAVREHASVEHRGHFGGITAGRAGVPPDGSCATRAGPARERGEWMRPPTPCRSPCAGPRFNSMAAASKMSHSDNSCRI